MSRDTTTVKLPIPETPVCTAGLLFIWPKQQEGLSCLCPAVNSADGRAVFESCAQGCESDLRPRLTENGQVSVSGLSSSDNGTNLHFVCSTDSCIENCFIKTIVSSYKVVFSGGKSRYSYPLR